MRAGLAVPGFDVVVHVGIEQRPRIRLCLRGGRYQKAGGHRGGREPAPQAWQQRMGIEVQWITTSTDMPVQKGQRALLR